ncbi:hypothetical protein N1851_009761 [Merluccius polli]|uniref:Uncharacterized protein n=1 Tax=Merluccius polli TaxID=89951 RepID=A0AA47N0I8_MERPO|nr:hypothetical protein N1851_009761 [Merluccius polli]
MVYGERIASYRNVFQQHKEFYFKNPLAKQLLAIQSEKEDIECRIKALEDQIAMKQEDLKTVVGTTVDPPLTENQAENVLAQRTEVEPVTQCDHQTDVSSSIASLHLNQTEKVAKRNFTGKEISCDVIKKSSVPSDQKSSADPDQQCGRKTQEDPAGSSAREEEMKEEEEEDEEGEDEEEDEEEEEQQSPPVTDEGDDDGDDVNDQSDTALPHSSSPPRNNPPSPLGRMKRVPSTPTFSINSPNVSPGRGSSHRKSPSFLFSTNSGPSTPSFPGFGFDIGSAQEEVRSKERGKTYDSPFAFTSSYFSEKVPHSHKHPLHTRFLFDHAERPEEDFHFSFSKSPGGSGSSQDKAAEDAFPFSFTYS